MRRYPLNKCHYHFLSEFEQVLLALVHILLISLQSHAITTLPSGELDIYRELVHDLTNVLASLSYQPGILLSKTMK